MELDCLIGLLLKVLSGFASRGVLVMNILRKTFLKLSQMPPALMLLIIIGMVVIVTMMVTGRMSQLESERGQDSTYSFGSVVAFVSTRPIVAGERLNASMVKRVQLGKEFLWQDAFNSVRDIENREAKVFIPEYAQIRGVDLR